VRAVDHPAVRVRGDVAVIDVPPAPVMATAMRRANQKDLAKLKRVLETMA
jgi:hypothetical protein